MKMKRSISKYILQIYSTTEEYFQLDWKIAKNLLWYNIQVELEICTKMLIILI
jgi:hypothetical protein